MVTKNRECRENSESIRMLHDVNGDTIVTFSDEAFLGNIDYLIDQYTKFAVKEVGWSPEYSRQLAVKGLNVDTLTKGVPLTKEFISFLSEDLNKARRIPSVSLYRPEDGPRGVYTGISAQRMFFPNVRREGSQVEEEVPVLYHIFRAFDESKRGYGRGKFSVQLAFYIHRGARYYMHRTGNYIGAYANTRSPVLNQASCYPFSAPYEENSFEYHLARKVQSIVGGPGTEIDLFGVSRGDYLEPNHSLDFRPDHIDPNHRGSMRMLNRFKKVYKMGPLDGIYPLYKAA